MAKKSKRKKLTDKLDGLCRDIIYIRDNGLCQRCGKHVEGQDSHTSHVIPKSRGNFLRWDLLNLKLLCFHCHINFWHKSPIEAGRWFVMKFPARWMYLEPLKDKTIKYTIPDLEELVEERKQKLTELRAEK